MNEPDLRLHFDKKYYEVKDLGWFQIHDRKAEVSGELSDVEGTQEVSFTMPEDIFDELKNQPEKFVTGVMENQE